jgi:hypothetical protein
MSFLVGVGLESLKHSVCRSVSFTNFKTSESTSIYSFSAKYGFSAKLSGLLSKSSYVNFARKQEKEEAAHATEKISFLVV